MLLDRYDPTEIVDILLDSGITDEDILDSMEELIMLNPDIFMDRPDMGEVGEHEDTKSLEMESTDDW